MEYIEYFEENCKKFPDVTALRSVTNKVGITYGQLNQTSASVYAYLKKKGIGKEQMVFIYLPRDTGIVVAMLGVIKAGAAFLVCEDTYPRDRVEFIKKDCGCVLTIDEKLFEEMMTEAPLYGHEVTAPHDACFAVYTSGSTGNPKGVLHEYGKLMQITESVVNISPELPIGSSHALLAPFNFVASIIVVFMLMYRRLCLYILPYNIAKNVTKLSKFIKNEDVKEAFLSLGILKLCKDNLYEGLIHIFSGGEAYNNICLPKGVCFDGTYCSSESAFVVASFRIEKAYDKTPAGKNRIGVEILILDDDGHRVPDGQKGEICFKNEFTRGYINLPEKTAEAFAGGVYHMGDLGYIGENGNLFVCGRKDDMIKIRGNRIEPAEIEAAIKNKFGISNVVAKGFQDENGSFVCVYFLEEELRKKNLLKENGSLVVSKGEFYDGLSKKLPYYMIPSYYLILPLFPVGANGKLDKKQLKKPDLESLQHEYVAPSNEIEEKLCSVMASVLGGKCVGATDDFYEMGGGSISAIEVITRMKLDMLDVNMFLKGRTPQKIAALYEKTVTKGNASDPLRAAAAMFPKRRRKIHNKVFRFIIGVTRKLWNISVKGIENLPDKTPYVLCSNHLSNMDAFCFFAALGRQCPDSKKIAVLAKKEVMTTRILRFLAEAFGVIPVDCEGFSDKALMEGLKWVQGGGCLLIYPEGTRSPNGKLGYLHGGFAKIAKIYGAPVVPIRIDGTFECYPKSRKFPRFFKNGKRFPINVTIKKPIDPSYLSEEELKERVREEIEK